MPKTLEPLLFTLAAGAQIDLPVDDADFISCYQTSGDIQVSVNGDPFTWFAQGITYQRGPDVISRVIVKNVAGASVTFRIIAGRGAFIDSRGAVFGTQTQAKPARFESAVHVTVAATIAVQVVAADLDRVAVILSNLEANGSPVYYGDSTISAGRGAELPVGASVSLPTTAAVHVFNPSGAACLVGVSEVLD